MTNFNCPICESILKSRSGGHGDRHNYDCPRCGLFGLTGSAEATLPGLMTLPKLPELEKYRRSLLSYSIRKMQTIEHWPVIDSHLLKDLAYEKQLPKPAEQARNLLIWLGTTLNSPESREQIPYELLQSIIGAASPDGVHYVLAHLDERKLVKHREPTPGLLQVGLTFPGWEEFERLQRITADSRIAFMAMQFNDLELDNVVNTIFRPAVEQTGFELRILSDVPRAGLIDDRLRVEIRQSRFLIADLTHRNPGAYWEAGFGEGLGKPVIYTCKKEVFNVQSSHFDTNHHLTVMWESSDPRGTAENLKATIRATLPEEAKLND